jgi:hypothetical protein
MSSFGGSPSQSWGSLLLAAANSQGDSLFRIRIRISGLQGSSMTPQAVDETGPGHRRHHGPRVAVSAQKYNLRVFVNCPLDRRYGPLLRAATFAVFDCG